MHKLNVTLTHSVLSVGTPMSSYEYLYDVSFAVMNAMLAIV